jgi:hypothetical protein
MHSCRFSIYHNYEFYIYQLFIFVYKTLKFGSAVEHINSLFHFNIRVSGAAVTAVSIVIKQLYFILVRSGGIHFPVVSGISIFPPTFQSNVNVAY